jgi:hypothetical protein
MSNTKNDAAWEQLFKIHDILSAIDKNGSFEISAAQINQLREARLMTKFDHKANLPRIFADNNLSILPITRGSYIISHFDTYKNFAAILSWQAPFMIYGKVTDEFDVEVVEVERVERISNYI